ncbi:hypothetical protein BS50DRAFT_626746 [Corynespora cassiicola Philippines]|uniref:Beta-galactosidase trimerisation domain-containing protein n=1 Tax=Corynespora cassiicola Philippines TaxID=1448308 RepID=A0A2T2N369_CORCC|nr:hypothetical protein BS50DRAFT_626746 [Corynespora cassiicola Philippines]
MFSSRLFAILILVSGCSPSQEQARPWWEKPFGMFQTNLREIDADMDVNATADWLLEFGASAWLIGVGGILANYETDLEFHTRNPYLRTRESGDLVGDALQAAKSRGIKLLARMDFSKVQAEVADEHPEWLFVSPTGERQTHTNGLVSVCPSAEYYQERIFEILEEATSRYDFDGFFVNWAGFNENDYFKIYHGVCHCESCQSRWRNFTSNKELPDGPKDPQYSEWRAFSNGIVEDWTARVTEFIHERLPHAGLILGDSADIRFHEANNAVDRDFWPHLTTQTVSDLKSYRPEVPILVNSVSFIDMPYRMGGEEPAHFAQYLLQAISRGANPSTYIMGYPGRIPYHNLDIAGQITRFHKKWQDVYNGLQPAAKTGVILPASSRITNTTQFDEAISEFRGIYSTLQELHIFFDVIGHTRLVDMATTGVLQRYKTMVVPNIGDLTKKEAQILDDWVASGGYLVTTGNSGIKDDREIQLKSLPSQDVLEVVRKRELLWSSYMAPTQQSSDVYSYHGPMIPIYGAYHIFTWKEGSCGLYNVLPRAPFAPPEYAYGHTVSQERGVGIGTYKDGMAASIPFNIGRAYRELGLTTFRDFFKLILDKEPRTNEKLNVTISSQVEATIMSKGTSLIVVHLINMSGARYQNFGSHLPIPAGSIEVMEKNVTAYALLSERELDVLNGSIILPGLDLFEVIVINWVEQA